MLLLVCNWLLFNYTVCGAKYSYNFAANKFKQYERTLLELLKKIMRLLQEKKKKKHIQKIFKIKLKKLKCKSKRRISQ